MVLLDGMKSTVPIDQAGRIVLPKAMRQELAIGKGDLLEVSVEGMKITLVPRVPAGSLVKKGHGLVFSPGTSKPVSAEEVNNLLQADRDERSRHMLRQPGQRRKR